MGSGRIPQITLELNAESIMRTVDKWSKKIRKQIVVAEQHFFRTKDCRRIIIRKKSDDQRKFTNADR